MSLTLQYFISMKVGTRNHDRCSGPGGDIYDPDRNGDINSHLIPRVAFNHLPNVSSDINIPDFPEDV